MWLRMGGGLLVVVALAVGNLAGQDKAGAKAGAKEVVGKVKVVDMTKKTFTITLTDGKDRLFQVKDNTKFIGPKGGVSKEGLADDRMGKGNEVKVTPAKDEKVAAEVHLPVRMNPAKDKKD